MPVNQGHGKPPRDTEHPPVNRMRGRAANRISVGNLKDGREHIILTPDGEVWNGAGATLTFEEAKFYTRDEARKAIKDAPAGSTVVTPAHHPLLRLSIFKD